MMPNQVNQLPASPAQNQGHFRKRLTRSQGRTFPCILIAMLFSTIMTGCVATAIVAFKLVKHQNVFKPNSVVEWEGCGEINEHKVECASLHVPIDHFNKSRSPETFSIPLIRMLASNTSATGGKSILLNPGGPGGSGVNLLRTSGEHLNKIIGEGFHLLSFDPRGVKGSTPRAICYVDTAQRVASFESSPWNIEFQAGEMFTRAENNAKACIETTGNSGMYINTPQTAADMNSILEAIGQEEMYYWGLSYGTILGQTYAQMFPERVGRIVIDGVANLDEWYNSFFPEEFSTDTDNVFAGFVEECFKAKKNCALTSIDGVDFRTGAELENYIDDFLQDLEVEPVAVYRNDFSYGAVTKRTLVINGIFRALYTPDHWPTLAKNLAKLMNGDANSSFDAYSDKLVVKVFPDESFEFVVYNDNWKTGAAAPVHGTKQIQNYTLSMAEESKLISKYLVSKVFDRASWSIQKTHDFHPHYYPEYPQVKSAQPILVISTTYDPVCPLISAKKAQSSFEGAGLLEQTSYGHSSLSMPSTCTAKHVQRYFNQGLLPEAGATCDIDAEYFPAPTDSLAQREEDVTSEDADLLAALRDLASGHLFDDIWSRRSARPYV